MFCDLSTPKNDGTFSVYNDIRKKLIERGVPESEVCFIHEADTDVKKKELFQKTCKGEVRVLLGSASRTLYDFIKIPILRHIQMPNLISMSSL